MVFRSRIIVLGWFVVCWFQQPAFGIEKGVSKLVSPSVRYLGEQYFTQIEKVSKIHFVPKQKECLQDYLPRISLAPLNPNIVKKRRREYLRKKKQLKQGWCWLHGRSWPNVVKLVDNSYKTVHNIFHLSDGGPNEYWNIHPIEENIHHSIIHASGAPGEVLHGKYLFKEINNENKNAIWNHNGDHP